MVFRHRNQSPLKKPVGAGETSQAESIGNQSPLMKPVDTGETSQAVISAENLFLSDEIMWEAGRLKTFKNWPFKKNHACSPEAMARAGFYSLDNEEENDLAKCFVCLKELNGWEANDDPIKEHKSHCPNCKFVRLQKEEKQITVYEMIDLFNERIVNIMDSKFKEELNVFDDYIANLLGRLRQMVDID